MPAPVSWNVASASGCVGESMTCEGSHTYITYQGIIGWGNGKILCYMEEEEKEKSTDCAWHLADALLATTLLELEARC